MRAERLVAVNVVLAAGVWSLGCTAARPGLEPAFRFTDARGTYVGFDTDRNGRVDYVQKLVEGRKVVFYRDVDGTGRLEPMTDRSPGTVPGPKHLWVLLEGVQQHRNAD